ncbi:MAG: winged helix-turn-helix domain-containing protein [Hyphomonas sp.]|nr:winged helix-turn-helix domain-containing protein [Hyphomonas sp.]
MPDTLTIGDWTFEPETGALTRDGESQRLEARAADLLALLCRKRGDLVSHTEIIDTVWDGRSVSPNSVAVVISDIRRALGDDPKSPRFVETLPKRGYRMLVTAGIATPGDTEAVPERQPEGTRLPRRPLAAIGAFAAIILLAGIVFLRGGPSVPAGVTRISVAAIGNETGDESYAALSTAVSELLVFEVMRQDTLSVRPEHEVGVVVGGTLILWDGHPAISLQAKSVGDGRILWSGMAPGPESDLPQQVRREISVLAEAAGRKEFTSLSADRSGG